MSPKLEDSESKSSKAHGELSKEELPIPPHFPSFTAPLSVSFSASSDQGSPKGSFASPLGQVPRPVNPREEEKGLRPQTCKNLHFCLPDPDPCSADSRQLWVWRNDQQVRQASRSTGPITWKSHQSWYAAAATDPLRTLYVVRSESLFQKRAGQFAPEKVGAPGGAAWEEPFHESSESSLAPQVVRAGGFTRDVDLCNVGAIRLDHRIEQGPEWGLDLEGSSKHARPHLQRGPQSVWVSEISLSIAPECRRRGWGRLVIQALCEGVFQNGSIWRLLAAIGHSNASSLALFTSTGFEQTPGSEPEGFGLYELRREWWNACRAPGAHG